jgi:tRNA(fMet)-specific endonuclease VapC
MNGRFLLDPNIAIAFLEGESSVRQRFAEVQAIFVSSIVLGELYFGADKSARVEANLARIEDLARITNVLVGDEDTTQQYGQIKNQLRAKGRALTENDIWIAAIAI